MSSIQVDSLVAVAGEYLAKLAEQSEDDEANADYLERKKERKAVVKELKETIKDLMAESSLATYKAGDATFTLATGPKVKVNLKRVRDHMGEAAFLEYSENNVEHEERVRIKKPKK